MTFYRETTCISLCRVISLYMKFNTSLLSMFPVNIGGFAIYLYCIMHGDSKQKNQINEQMFISIM